jgi:hypothetical protein
MLSFRRQPWAGTTPGEPLWAHCAAKGGVAPAHSGVLLVSKINGRGKRNLNAPNNVHSPKR